MFLRFFTITGFLIFVTNAGGPISGNGTEGNDDGYPTSTYYYSGSGNNSSGNGCSGVEYLDALTPNFGWNGSIIGAAGGSIVSQTEPFYGSLSNCSWVIYPVTFVGVVEVTFISFDVEQESSCVYDSVEVLSGNSSLSGLMCGQDGFNRTFRSPSPSEPITIQFTSDGSVNREGFTVSFREVVSEELLQEMVITGSEDVYSECGTFRLSEDFNNSWVKGYLESPNYPEEYNSNLRCKYTITLADLCPDIFLEFNNRTQIEDDGLCAYDFIEVIEGHSDIRGRVCGSTFYDYQYFWADYGRNLTFAFVSDSSVEYSGFSITLYC